MDVEYAQWTMSRPEFESISCFVRFRHEPPPVLPDEIIPCTAGPDKCFVITPIERVRLILIVSFV
jgi:hypothetical protein